MFSNYWDFITVYESFLVGFVGMIWVVKWNLQRKTENTQMINKTSALPIFFLISIFLASCDSNITHSPTEQALQIRLSINNNNVKKLRALSSLPLIVREQEWESANDGSGFILGATKQSSISTDEAFNKKIMPFLKSLQIKGEQAITDITLNMFTTELGKQVNNWADLKLILFKRGEGDVEHIVLMGLSKKTNKLKAIYIN